MWYRDQAGRSGYPVTECGDQDCEPAHLQDIDIASTQPGLVWQSEKIMLDISSSSSHFLPVGQEISLHTVQPQPAGREPPEIHVGTQSQIHF